MPYPIMPNNTNVLNDLLFGGNQTPEEEIAMSNNLDIFSNFNFSIKEAETKISDESAKLLEIIDKNIDENQTALQSVVANVYSKKYLVPLIITDNQLLNLKANGLVEGYYRSVAFTKKGEEALRKYYFSKANAFKKPAQFDYYSALEKLKNNE